eukprot:scaffold2622_cov32-Phaeocystis_antarctica.AAC.4
MGELGVRGIEVLSARRSGCEARTTHRAPEARAVAQRPSCRGTRGRRDDLAGKSPGLRRREDVAAAAKARR